MTYRHYPTAAGIIDRTGLLLAFAPIAVDRIGLDLEIVDLGSPADLGPATPRVQVLLLGPKELSNAGLRKAVRYQAAHPGTVVVAAGASAEGPTRAELRASGIRHVMRGALTPAKLAATLGRAYQELLEIAEGTYGMLEDQGPLPGIEPEVGADYEEDEGVPELTGELGGARGEAVAEAQPGTELGEVDCAADSEESNAAAAMSADPVGGPRIATVVTVASATGGCGKTFFATNLAALIARSGHKCLLVDMDLQFGEVAAALRVRHPYSVFDGLYDGEGRALPKEDMAAHLGRLVHHHALGFDVLTAPRDPAMADYVGAKDATTILDAVTPAYEVVVVDTPPSLNEVVLTVLDRSDVVAVLATLDVPSLKNLSVFLDTLRRLRIDDARMRLILNKVEEDIGISGAQAQEAFDNGFVAEIPLARAVSRAINAGTVVVEMEPRSAVSRHMTAAAASVLPMAMIGPSTTETTTASWWLRLFRRHHARHVVADHIGGSS